MDLDELGKWFADTARQFEAGHEPPVSDKAVKIIKVILSADIKENFAGSHEPDGTPWAKLKRPRRNSNGADKPLLDWGVLRASAAAEGHEQDVATIQAIARGIRVEMDGERIRGHDGSVKGQWHRLGTSRGIPAREFLGVSQDAAEAIAQVVAEDRAERAVV